MERISDLEDIARARATFELYEFAETTMRQNLRRRFPRESDEEIERRLVSWLRKEPRDRWDGPEPPSLSSLQSAQRVTRFEQALIRLAGDLQALGVHWALAGGMAVSFRAEPSKTQDIAVAIGVGSDPDTEQITLSLKLRGYQPQPVQHSVEAVDGRLSAARLLCPGDEERAVGVDLLFAFSGIEEEIVTEAEACEVLPGLRVPLARDRALDRSQGPGRPLQRPGRCPPSLGTRPDSRARVAEILELIQERGFHRGKNLQDEFASFLESE